MVAIMAELAQITPDSKVLEIGTGSGYGAAVLAELAAAVYTIEILEPLAKGAEAAGTAAGGGRYITFAGMHTIHVDDERARRPASHNIGMYRAQLVDATRLVMHWHLHHDGAAHWRSWRRAGRPMPMLPFGEPIPELAPVT